MHDVANILSSVFRSSIDDLRQHYSWLARLEPKEREIAVARAAEALASTREAIADPSTLLAKDVLLVYQYITRFIYDVETRSKEHFIGSLTRLGSSDDLDLAAWRWTVPSRAVFLSCVQSRLAGVDFYSQVNLLCDELFGVPVPSATDLSVHSWADRARLLEVHWAWSYENKIRDEKARWFSSQKSISAIQSQWAEHRSKAARCIEEISPIFHEIPSATSRLQDLKAKELQLSVQCSSMERAADALREGLALEHLVLKEAHEMRRVSRAVTKGL